MRNEYMAMLVLFPFVTQTFAMTADGESALRNGALGRHGGEVDPAAGGRDQQLGRCYRGVFVDDEHHTTGSVGGLQSFFNAVKTSCVSVALKERGECVALRYAGSANLYFRRMDEAMISTEPAYRNSKCRLVVLRSAYELGVSQYQIAYVTNAINELVAYPEADLPE